MFLPGRRSHKFPIDLEQSECKVMPHPAYLTGLLWEWKAILTQTVSKGSLSVWQVKEIYLNLLQVQIFSQTFFETLSVILPMQTFLIRVPCVIYLCTYLCRPGCPQIPNGTIQGEPSITTHYNKQPSQSVCKGVKKVKMVAITRNWSSTPFYVSWVFPWM